MNTEKKCSLGVCLLVGLLAIAVSLPIAVGKYAASSRSVTVKGLCEREVKADRAIWPIVYKEGGNDLSALSKSVTRQNEIILEWLSQAGFSSEEVSVSAPKVEDTKTNSYDQRSYNYIMTSVITVCSSDVDKVRQMQSRQFDLLEKGIAIGAGSSWEYPIVYDYTALNDIKPEMIEQATLGAREAANKFAKDSGSRVGRIISASQGQFSIYDRDSNTPYIKTVRVVTTIQYSLK